MDDSPTFLEDLEELCSAEDFLDYFGIAYDPKVVQVNRLHILQRFHDYLARATGPGDQPRPAIYKQWLEKAYQDFVHSDALTEKVFRVFHTVANPQGGSTAFVPLDKVFKS